MSVSISSRRTTALVIGFAVSTSIILGACGSSSAPADVTTDNGVAETTIANVTDTSLPPVTSAAA